MVTPVVKKQFLWVTFGSGSLWQQCNNFIYLIYVPIYNTLQSFTIGKQDFDQKLIFNREIDRLQNDTFLQMKVVRIKLKMN